MALVTPYIGEVRLQSHELGVIAAPASTHWHLYTNNHAPAGADTLGNYTECTVAGYATQNLPAAGWTVGTVGSVTSATGTQLTFSLTGAVNIYGYYVTDPTDTYLLWSEEFSGAPIAIPAGVWSLFLTPYQQFT